MHFFESNPYGRLFNRATKDQQIIDETLPFVLFDAIQILLMAVGAVIILCIVNVWITILLIPVVPIFWMLRRYYMRSGRQLKRLQSISRSPVYALFSASLYGLATIRAFKVETDYIQFFMNRIDANTRTYINMIAAAMWFGLILDLITALFSLVPPILAVMYRDKMDLSLIALTLMYCINMTGWFQWGVRQSAEAENLMTSAERIAEYGRLPREEDDEDSKGFIRTPKDWPNHGAIEFRDYSLRYQTGLEPSLKNITFITKAAEKIGVIGRTGTCEHSFSHNLLFIFDLF
jgi:ATP-binding cassette subfamily C (CFTR/MRP) protein 4